MKLSRKFINNLTDKIDPLTSSVDERFFWFLADEIRKNSILDQFNPNSVNLHEATERDFINAV
jgi:hypothetical protein